MIGVPDLIRITPVNEIPGNPQRVLKETLESPKEFLDGFGFHEGPIPFRLARMDDCALNVTATN